MQYTWKDKCLNESLWDEKHLIQSANKRMSKRSRQPITYLTPTIPLSLMFIIFFSFILLFSHTAFDPPTPRTSWPTSTYAAAIFFSALSHSFTHSISFSYRSRCGCLGILCSFITVMVQMSRKKDRLPFPLSVSPSRSLISLLLELVIVPLLSSTIPSKNISDGLC